MSTAMTSGPKSQDGVILALGLMLLLIISMLATSGMTNATLETIKTGSGEAMDNAFFAAENGITMALSGGDFSHTRRSTLPVFTMPDGTPVATQIRYVGLGHPSDEEPDAGLVEYHFLIETTAQAMRSAKSQHVLQVMVLAPPPADPSICLSTGCDIPVICPPTPDECETPLRFEPLRVAWHISEDLP
jgi:hypothetical protein